MKLSDYRNTYYEFSGKASDVVRGLAFAGIALVWVFKTGQAPDLSIPPDLLPPAGLLALTLVFDLLQYIGATVVWGIFQWHEERKLADVKLDPELDSPAWLKWPQFLFFVLKLCTIIVAYSLLVTYVWTTWKAGN